MIDTSTKLERNALNMCKLTESHEYGDAEVDIEQEPELRPIWVVAKVDGTLHQYELTHDPVYSKGAAITQKMHKYMYGGIQ
jgi:hypothetical protein